MATKKSVKIKSPKGKTPAPRTNDPRVSGKSLKALPVYNGQEFDRDDTVTAAIVRNVRSRRTFVNGRDFINRVVESMSGKFPEMTQKSLDGRVCRVLARYFN